MIDVTDRSHTPSRAEIAEYIGNPLFFELCAYLEDGCGARAIPAYSGDRQLLGWNLPFAKGGRTLCRLYPKRGFFSLLIVVGRKERERVEALLSELCERVRNVYENTPEGMGQRWLLIDLAAPDGAYRDVKRLVDIRKQSR